MKKSKYIRFLPAKASVAVLLTVSGIMVMSAQELKIEKISLSTWNYDEISPVLYSNGIVFCTNRRANSLTGYSNNESGLFKLFYAARSSKSGLKIPVLFSNAITTSFNEGPATFNKQGSVIYFTRNNDTRRGMSNVTDTTNNLGIYTAELINGIWQNIHPFTYNNPLYTFVTPALTQDGQRLYFASDMPGGSGGMDIYFCRKCGNDWCEPVNAGPEINTMGNESYPFAHPDGKVYFASDGRRGLGGKDIFYTFEQDGQWVEHIPADSLINSPSNDYGIFVDSTGLNGYFTSDRLSSDDIFSFTSVLPEFPDCDTFREPDWCYTIYDEQYIPNDTLVFHYKWDFGDGIIKYGPQVGHCFPGPGDYTVLLDITDEITGDTIAWQVEYNVTLEPPAQLFINSPNIGLTGKEISLSTYGSVLGGGEITDYLWNFGDGFKPGISHFERKFHNAGKYTVSAGMKNSVTHGCVSKEIRILESLTAIKQIETGNGTIISLLASSEISTDVLSFCVNALNTSEIQQDLQAILTDSDSFLKKIASVVMNNPDIHLDIQVYNNDLEFKSLSDSRELSFFLENHIPDNKLYGVQAVGEKQVLTSNTGKSVQRIYEFILTKK